MGESLVTWQGLGNRWRTLLPTMWIDVKAGRWPTIRQEQSVQSHESTLACADGEKSKGRCGFRVCLWIVVKLLYASRANPAAARLARAKVIVNTPPPSNV